MHFGEFWTKFGYFNSKLVAFHHFSPGNSLTVIPSLPWPVTCISSTLDLAVWCCGFQTCEQKLNNNDFIQGELYWFSTFSTKYCSKSAFFGVFQILMILHKSVCTAQNHQSLLVPLFSIVYTKIGWQFCTHLQSHKVKENVQFYKSYQKRLMILHYAYTFVQNHQSLR